MRDGTTALVLVQHCLVGMTRPVKATYSNADMPSESCCYSQLLLEVVHLAVLKFGTVTGLSFVLSSILL